jgi:hypothetical protein
MEESTTRRTRCFACGTFGISVISYLRSLRPDIEVGVDWTTVGKMSSEYNTLVLAASRPEPVICDLFDQECAKGATAFIPLILDSCVLRLGPLVLPGTRCCWRCWSYRILQHSDSPRHQRAINDFYSAHPNVGPQGYLEPFALMGAARILQALAGIQNSVAEGGYYWQLNVITRDVISGIAVGISGCSRCGTHYSVGSRTCSKLREHLAGALHWPRV